MFLLERLLLLFVGITACAGRWGLGAWALGAGGWRKSGEPGSPFGTIQTKCVGPLATRCVVFLRWWEPVQAAPRDPASAGGRWRRARPHGFWGSDFATRACLVA